MSGGSGWDGEKGRTVQRSAFYATRLLENGFEI